MCFIATRLLRDAGAGPTILVSPLLALMRNQIRMAERAGFLARTINSENRDNWQEITSTISRDEVDLLLVSPARPGELGAPDGRGELAARAACVARLGRAPFEGLRRGSTPPTREIRQRLVSPALT